MQATAVQYIKRFYITNSVMTYHPSDMVKTALYFATKTENHYMRLSKFAESIDKTKAEDVLASEFLLTQGLRFTFDVRHPFRALEGAVMELQAIANQGIQALPGQDELQVPEELGDINGRIRNAHGAAREYLKTSALLTDVYFHYTPSQIMFSALFLADLELISWYLSTKFPPESSGSALEKVRETLQGCANMLSAVSPKSAPSDEEKTEARILSKKLKKCRNPEKIDLVAANRAAKRDGAEDGPDEKVIKKRKMERERVEKEGSDLFGPALKKE
jgi:cyclin H